MMLLGTADVAEKEWKGKKKRYLKDEKTKRTNSFPAVQPKSRTLSRKDYSEVMLLGTAGVIEQEYKWKKRKRKGQMGEREKDMFVPASST